MCNEILFIHKVITVIQYTRVSKLIGPILLLSLEKISSRQPITSVLSSSRVAIGRSLGYCVTAQEVARDNKMLERQGLSVPEEI
jgi:hypothetical protein